MRPKNIDTPNARLANNPSSASGRLVVNLPSDSKTPKAFRKGVIPKSIVTINLNDDEPQTISPVAIKSKTILTINLDDDEPETISSVPIKSEPSIDIDLEEDEIYQRSTPTDSRVQIITIDDSSNDSYLANIIQAPGAVYLPENNPDDFLEENSNAGSIRTEESLNLNDDSADETKYQEIPAIVMKSPECVVIDDSTTDSLEVNTSGPVEITDNTSESSDDEPSTKRDRTSLYERRRLENIAEMQLQIRQRFGDGPSNLSDVPQPSTSGLRANNNSARRRRYIDKLRIRPTRKSIRLKDKKLVGARVIDDDDSDEDQNPRIKTVQALKEKVFLQCGDEWPKKCHPIVIPTDEDAEEASDNEASKKPFYGFSVERFQGFARRLNPVFHKEQRRQIWRPRISLRRRSIKSPEEITPEDIQNIFYKSSGKMYDSANGTTCHQCRQKTKDTKTVCRGKECSGVRGQFCGFCLKSRYGEDAAEALKNPTWSCPPCRGVCNCSICRTRSGKIPTGILAPRAIDRGYDSVKHYLESINEE